MFKKRTIIVVEPRTFPGRKKIGFKFKTDGYGVIHSVDAHFSLGKALFQKEDSIHSYQFEKFDIEKVLTTAK